ncbi:hypothetical protein [Streptomyces luteireticuli]|uniref:Uncharacterized protein n=1 Tax=Streptomyces luteireticuli TaxID=173858 RepID=A0ABN0YZU7_9ACTN
MAEYYFPFDSGAGTTVTADAWSHMASMWQADGVRTPRAGEPNPLGATVTGQDMTVTLAPGHASLRGFHYYSDARRSVVIAPNTGTQPRIDRITVRLNRAGQRIAIAYLQGTPAAKPQPPALSQGQDGIVDVPLHRITVAPQAGAITTTDITDERIWAPTPATYADAAARKAAPERPVPGQLAYLQAEDRMDLYTQQSWSPLTPGPWQRLELARWRQPHGAYPSWRLVNGTVELTGAVAMMEISGPDFPVSDYVALVVLPPEARPSHTRSFVCSTSRNTVKGSTCRVDIAARTANNAGDVIADIQSPVKWVYLDGIRFTLDT